jgi:hypothetical protein
MSPATRTLRCTFTVLALVALAATAHAGGHVAPGGCDDTALKSRGAATSESAAGPSSSSRHENTSVGPAEDVYLPLSRSATPVASPAQSVHPAEATAAPAAPHAETPAAAHKAAVKHAWHPTPAPPRAKVSIPDLPARPGMGTLLRVGITAGRELS